MLCFHMFMINNITVVSSKGFLACINNCNQQSTHTTNYCFKRVDKNIFYTRACRYSIMFVCLMCLSEPMPQLVGGKCTIGIAPCLDPNANCSQGKCVCNTNYKTKTSDPSCGKSNFIIL